MRFVLPLLFLACNSVSAGDPCDVGGDTARTDGQDYVCQCSDASLPTGPCNGSGEWVAVNSSADACDVGGDRDCDGDDYRMCLCSGDDPFDRACPEGGTWTPQTTLCASCDEWLNDDCPVE